MFKSRSCYKHIINVQRYVGQCDVCGFVDVVLYVEGLILLLSTVFKKCCKLFGSPCRSVIKMRKGKVNKAPWVLLHAFLEGLRNFTSWVIPERYSDDEIEAD